jgi:hypothetical protein
MVFCLEWAHNALKCDLLLPIVEESAASTLMPRAEGQLPRT